MVRILGLVVAFSTRFFRFRRDLLLENLALRQQFSVMIPKRLRGRLTSSDKLFWALLCCIWSGWKRAILIVQPETVIRWHRAGFKLYWKWFSRKQAVVGRKPTSRKLRELIFRIVAENRTWGAPRIHGELKMFGFDILERTVLRWKRKAPRNPEAAKRWAAFLSNHRVAIAAMDFFTMPTLTFGTLYCFFAIAHDRRRILHFNVTRHPTSEWVSQQLREAFSYETAPKYLIHDRDSIFNTEVAEAMKVVGLKSVRTTFTSPWQNGIADLKDWLKILERKVSRSSPEAASKKQSNDNED